MQTRGKRRTPEDAAENEKPQAKKRGRPSLHASQEEQTSEKSAKRSPLPHRRRPQAKARPSKNGMPAAVKKGMKGAPSQKRQESNSPQDKKKEAGNKIKINRAPVLTMWVAVVAEREGYSYEEGLTFGKAIAGLLAQSKGRSLGVYEEPSEEKKEERKKKRKDMDRFSVFGMNVPGKIEQDGHRVALQSGKPIVPSSVAAYLHKSFGADYERAKDAMEDLANSFPSNEIGRAAYSLYEKFRPSVSYGMKGWGAKGNLDVEAMRAMRKA